MAEHLCMGLPNIGYPSNAARITSDVRASSVPLTMLQTVVAPGSTDTLFLFSPNVVDYIYLQKNDHHLIKARSLFATLSMGAVCGWLRLRWS